MPMSVEEILKLADPWSSPISDSAPSGTSAKEDERYLVVTTEIARIDSPSTEKLDWKKVWTTVISQGGEILQEKSKDLLIASQMAYAMYRLDGLKGLLKGVALLTVLVENFWPTLWPELKRIKGRTAAVQWFLDKGDIQLKQYTPAPGDRDVLDSLAAIIKRFNASAREKYGDATPAIGKLREAIERLSFDAGPSQEELDAQKAEEDAKVAAAAEERARAEAAAKAKADADARAREAAAAQAAAQAAAAPEVPATPQQQLAAFEQRFADERSMAPSLARLQAAAQRRGFTLDQAEFKLANEATEPLLRYTIGLPVKADYRALRRFSRDALRDLPGLALDEVSLRRSDPKSPQLEAQLRFVLFLAKPAASSTAGVAGTERQPVALVN